MCVLKLLHPSTMSQRALCVQNQQLKSPPWPEEPVSVRYSHWKNFRSGRITFEGVAGYCFTDARGNSYQCTPGYQPVDIKILCSGEDWSCYEDGLK